MSLTIDSNKSLAIVDARDWQNQFDLLSGDKSDEQGPLVTMMKEVLQQHPYPGDVDPRSNSWVTETALDLTARYQPQFVFLTYSRQYFASRFEQPSKPEWQGMMEELFREVEHFIAESGFTPVIVGRGAVMPLSGVIDLSMLDGIGVNTHWSARYAGLHEPSNADLKQLGADPNLERIITKNEFLCLFDGEPQDGQLLPEYLLVARRGYAFNALGCTMRKPTMIPNAEHQVPLFSPIGDARDLTDIRGVIDNGLQQGRKIALIILDGVGCDDFQWEYSPCGNSRDWFCYEPGDAQILTITSGRHRIFEYPPGHLFYASDAKEKNYPLSGYFTEIPTGTLGDEFPGRSISVGNKSMAMHMVTGADLCVECFARNLYNQGTLGVIHRQDKL